MTEPNTTSIPQGSLVLVTGANGFIASHIVKEFLERGYRVRGTVRDLKKSAFLVDEVFPDYAKRGDLELFEVPELGVPNAYEPAIRDSGVAAIVHVASPLTFDPNPHNVIPQTVGAALDILKAAARESSIKQFVYTSSAPVAIDTPPGVAGHITKDTWNEMASQMAWAPPPYEPSRGGLVYIASKMEAEKAIFKFVEEEKPSFDVNSVLPYTTLGKGLHSYHLRGTASWIQNMYDGQPGLFVTLPEPCLINVRDLAVIHVAAALDPEIKGERLFGWGEPFTLNDILALMRKMYPDHEFIDDIPNKTRCQVTKNDTLTLSLLKKWAGRDHFISLEETIREGLEPIS
ncbi:putative NAD dependent epimerase/dehydratase [Xylariales sp. PMI_506]|nr:putative NAD dependent epimerase/dehydratase [Xylariales sp. PMI_506]